MRAERMWINQPSSLQLLHALHGTRVLAVHESELIWCIYFLSGDIISMQVHQLVLSEGWPS